MAVPCLPASLLALHVLELVRDNDKNISFYVLHKYLIVSSGFKSLNMLK